MNPVAPRGDLFVCEDGSESDSLRGVTLNGEVYNFTHNDYNQSEFPVVYFSSDGGTMFVNIQVLDITLAILGTWTEQRNRSARYLSSDTKINQSTKDG